ncbi:MAG: ABC transporter substrate-binding protein [Gammaproteobacteria bacterium]|jgi:hypothetical protein
MAANHILIGIDDTDNLNTRGTGYRARCLAAELEEAGLARVLGVTRHQLLVDDAVPYTSHNSSACLGVTAAAVEAVIRHCREFLLRIAAEGSDVGLCIADVDTARDVHWFGLEAQSRVLQRREAEEVAAGRDIHLEGLSGDHQGKIGALAAVGLHAGGNDGRFLWVRNIRELADQTVGLAELLENSGVDMVMLLDNSPVNDLQSTVALGHWPRPIPVNGRAALLVEKDDGGNANWKVVAKETIKAYRP